MPGLRWGQVLRPYNRARSVEEEDDVALVAKSNLQDVRCVFDHAENPDDRRRIDRLAEGFVVEADVAAGDGRAESGAGFSEAVDSFAELPHHFRLFRAAEIEAIRGSDGACATAGHVAGRLRDGVHR